MGQRFQKRKDGGGGGVGGGRKGDHSSFCIKVNNNFKGNLSPSLPTQSDGCVNTRKKSPTKCLNSAARLPLVDSSMFITFVFVPKILNFLNLHKARGKN